MNPISIGTGTELQHIGTSQEVLRTIQTFLLQQKLTQESLGRLAQPWLVRAEAPGQSAWLRRWSSCFLPQLALLCLALLFLPSLSIPRIALCQGNVTHTFLGAPKNHLSLCLCHVLCPGQDTLYPYSGACKFLAFSTLQKSQWGRSGG